MLTSKDCWLRDSCKAKKKQACSSCDLFCVKLFKLTELFKNSLIPKTQWKEVSLYTEGVDSEAYSSLNSIREDAGGFINNGKNLLIYSSICGNGKTAWSLKILRSFFNSEWMHLDTDSCALFINVPKFFLSLKDNLSNKNEYASYILDKIQDVKVVVWDDIATKNITEFESEYMLSLIDGRISNGKSNIYTSNMNPENLYSLLGARLASRILGESVIIQLRGKDKRGFVV